MVQVHIRVASPPIKYPCYMGINIPTKEELIANRPEFQDIAGFIGESWITVLYLVTIFTIHYYLTLHDI